MSDPLALRGQQLYEHERCRDEGGSTRGASGSASWNARASSGEDLFQLASSPPELHCVAPQIIVVPHPLKHLKPAPSVAQSASPVQVFEQALPAELHPPSLATTGRSRHAPELHSPSALHVALAGLPVLLVVLLQPTITRTPARRTNTLFMLSA
jgi:hypothetical protein